MGSALMGHRVGDQVTFESPGGQITVTITDIE
jgi:transcription elongation GreA/GreB family factor